VSPRVATLGPLGPLFAALLLALPVAAAAQSPTGPTGPMTIERIHDGVAVSGGVKITEVDHSSGTLVGGEAGWLIDNSFLIGGGGYWLADNSHDRKMGYGGLVIQWLSGSGRRAGYGGKALIGGGEATLSDTFTTLVPIRIPTTGRVDVQPRTSTFIFERGFFIFEPEANAFVRVNRHVRVLGGVSYRVTASDGHEDSRLHGVAGTIGVQIS
jgi:hypothetical protein